ncbi:MAG: ABC transporter ATP-binding protein [Bacteroidales bacterium]|nr:ABC transporter ATP-binding protein [Bacteroidales bacterium]
MNTHKRQTYLTESNNLSIGYKNPKGKGFHCIQNELNLHLSAGKVYTLIGPNGAGKSTLIKTLAGFLPCVSGQILMNGQNLNAIPANQLARLLSVVFTDRPYTEHLRVYDMVAMGRHPYTGFMGKLRSEDNIKIDKVLNITGIFSLKDRFFNDLSDGEKQKVMIAKSLAQETKIIMLDEPTAFLDFPSRIEVMQLLRKIAREESKAILLSSHDITLSFRLSDEIILIAKGFTGVQDIPENIVSKNLMNTYFENASFNFDTHRLSFEPITTKSRKVHVEADEFTIALLSNMLKRFDFQLIQEGPHVFSIIQNHLGFQVNSPNGMFIINDLTLLAEFLHTYETNI